MIKYRLKENIDFELVNEKSKMKFNFDLSDYYDEKTRIFNFPTGYVAAHLMGQVFTEFLILSDFVEEINQSEFEEDVMSVLGSFVSTELDFIERNEKEKLELESRIDQAIQHAHNRLGFLENCNTEDDKQIRNEISIHQQYLSILEVKNVKDKRIIKQFN